MAALEKEMTYKQELQNLLEVTRKERHALERKYLKGPFRQDVSLVLDQCLMLEEDIEALLKEDKDV